MNLSDLLAGCNGYMFNSRAAPKQGTEINHSNISRKTAPASIASADAVGKKQQAMGSMGASQNSGTRWTRFFDAVTCSNSLWVGISRRPKYDYML